MVQKKQLKINENKSIAIDNEGFLLNLADWDDQVAKALAKKDNIENLLPIHWTVIEFLRDYYQRYELFPLIRQINFYVAQKLGKENAGSIALYSAFPYGALKQGAKIAGLVKPPSCL